MKDMEVQVSSSMCLILLPPLPMRYATVSLGTSTCIDTLIFSSSFTAKKFCETKPILKHVDAILFAKANCFLQSLFFNG
jgi:hypothetical protein